MKNKVVIIILVGIMLTPAMFSQENSPMNVTGSIKSTNKIVRIVKRIPAEAVQKRILAMNTVESDKKSEVTGFSVGIAPNPTVNTVNCAVQTQSAATLDVYVSDLFGNKLITKKLKADVGYCSLSFDLSSMPQGCYYINFTDYQSINYSCPVIKY